MLEKTKEKERLGQSHPMIRLREHPGLRFSNTCGWMQTELESW